MPRVLLITLGTVLLFTLPALVAAHGSHGHDDHHHHHHHHHHEAGDAHQPRTFAESVVDATVASFMTSILPICIIPVAAFVARIGTTTSASSPTKDLNDGLLLLCFGAFAAGAIIADVLHHVAPLLGSAGGSGSAFWETSWPMWFLLGFVSFFALDGAFVCGKGAGHAHSHSHTSLKVAQKRASGQKAPLTTQRQAAPSASASSRAVLSLLADFTHNLTDGLVLGMSAPTSRTVTYRRAIALMAHELPHEIGDYAVLSQCGWSISSIVLSQLITAVGNLLGCIVALLLRYWWALSDGNDEAHHGGGAMSALECFVGGSFLYLGTVVLMGDLSRRLEHRSMSAKLCTVIAFLAGVRALDVVPWVERAIA